jgi:hypothetical protein
MVVVERSRDMTYGVWAWRTVISHISDYEATTLSLKPYIKHIQRIQHRNRSYLLIDLREP